MGYMWQKSIGSITFSISRQRGQELEELEDDAQAPPAPLGQLAFAQGVHAVPSTHTSPEVGRSMPVIMLISVDLPLPDFPMTATNSP